MIEHRASHPVHTLLTVFLSWKALVLAIVLASSLTGPAYDTSTTLALGRDEITSGGSLVTRLTRWDAIYFTSAAHHGRVYEQEWAFGPGLPGLVSLLALVPRALGLAAPDDLGLEAAIGIIIAHASHWGAVWALYQLTCVLFGVRDKATGRSSAQDLAFFAALLHIISPAGVFLSAGYQEAPFAFLSFLGYLLVAKGHRDSGTFLQTTGLQVAAGCVFGLATVFRSNGILHGIPFAAECLRVVVTPLIAGENPLPHVVSLLGPIVGGLLVASGSVIPQAVAYKRYCGSPESPPWCDSAIPSIYTYVQEHYWGVGFLRYWTVSNIPLFLLAAPVLTILIKSGIEIAKQPSQLVPSARASAASQTKGKVEAKDKADTSSSPEIPSSQVLVVSLAVSQVTLTVLALASYHVQIITRLASGYPVWYWWVAAGLRGSDLARKQWANRIVTFSIVYALVQAALFACFLPPA
ncbi:mannosyltransferase [Plectosphaerella plurivora]|uniref:GPI mannosyltransferase 2 n=1 Tax=Plectosphaerella plurivora TaxID=936078 RepID=A0A9P8V951_9PEZI|nr:mannosyltransferase [Plectosphaerella plurivora]